MWTPTVIILLALLAHAVHVHRTHAADRKRYTTLVELAVLLTAVDKYHRESIDALDKRVATITGEFVTANPDTIDDITAAATRLRKLAADPGRHALKDQQP